LSIQSIVVRANEYLNKEIGSWFRPTTFVITLDYIFQKIPLFEKLQILNVSENLITLKDFIVKAFNDQNFQDQIKT